MSLLIFFFKDHGEILRLTSQHLFLVVAAMVLAIAIGIPVGVLLTRRASLRKPVLTLANVIQTIPSLALFGFLIPILGHYGIGMAPAVVALFLYSLLPIIQNTFTGIREVDPAIREAALGMGMTDWQLLTQVELPLALPVLAAGVRVATVISIGTATIAAAIGAGGLGTLIFRGLRMNDNELILAGAVPAALLAWGADFILGLIQNLLSPIRTGKKRKRKTFLISALLVVSVFAVGSVLFSTSEPKQAIVIGSKDFTEQLILGELMAQVIEKNGLPVERKFDLGGDLCHRALISGEIDGYAEYTGTAYTAILKHPPISNPRAVYDQTKKEYASRFQVEWLPPLGFNNTFAILIRGSDARRLHLKTISETARYTPGWRAGFGQDFMSRKDGYPGFTKTYGLQFKEAPKEMDLSLTYRALAGGQVDLIAGNSTDGLIRKLDLYELRDDRRYFPPYEAAPIARGLILQKHPEIKRAFEHLAGTISNEKMQQMNLEVDQEHRSPREVAKEFLDATLKQSSMSSPRKRGSIILHRCWIPAFAGMTVVAADSSR